MTRQPDRMSIAVNAIKAAVNVKAHAPCPMCGYDGWAGGDRLTEVTAPDATSFQALSFVCTNCGFVRLHAVQPLETIDD
jgi:predicted RNA-binding Zn-ribbon protein involved in translation (DUF1610 family)